MKRQWIVTVAATLGLICAVSAAAQDRGTWRADNSTARSITGDIVITDRKVEISFIGFTIAEIRKITPAEGTALFDLDSDSKGGGVLYRLNIPAAQRFLHKNTVCGTEQTEWMATYALGKTLHVAFFSGTNMPVLTFEALTNSTDFCGAFSYTR